MNALIQEAAELLEQLAEDKEAQITERYCFDGASVHPALQHRYDRDMLLVDRVRIVAYDLRRNYA